MADPTVPSATTVTLQLRSASGSDVLIGLGDVVTFASSDDGMASLGAVTDNDDGTYTATLTGVKEGSVTISAKMNGASFSSTASVEVQAKRA